MSTVICVDRGVAGGTGRRSTEGLVVALRVSLSGVGVDLTGRVSAGWGMVGRVSAGMVAVAGVGTELSESDLPFDGGVPCRGVLLVVLLNGWNVALTANRDVGVERWLPPL